MIIEKVKSISGLSKTFVDEKQTYSEELLKAHIIMDGISYDSYVFYYGNLSETPSVALIYEKIEGVMTPVVVKKKPENPMLNLMYGFSLQMAALKIENRFAEENVPYIKYGDIVDDLIINFKERLFN